MTVSVAAQAEGGGIVTILSAALFVLAATCAAQAWRTRRVRRELERQLQQKQQELADVKKRQADLYVAISHQLRNPINGVLGLTRILRGANLGSREVFLLGTLHRCAEHLRTTIEDLAALPAFHGGALEVRSESFDLADLVNSTLSAADLRGDRARLGAWTGPRPRLKGDAGKLGLILANFLGIALRHGKPPAASVDVTVVELEQDRCGVTLAVRHSGPDLPPAELEGLFERFGRAEYGNLARVDGTGVGLYASRRYAESLGGTVRASSFGGETELAVSVALEKSTENPAGTAAAPKGRVLVVEDEDYNRLVLGNLLSEIGYEVDWAPDGKSALSQAGDRHFDLVLTDWMLPDMEGGELSRQLLALSVEPKPLVLAVTAYFGPEKEAEARDAGMAGLITKPLTVEKLGAALRKVPTPPLPIGPAPAASADGDELSLEQLGRIGGGRNVVPEFRQRLAAEWLEVESLLPSDPAKAAVIAHRLISAGLVINARALCENLHALEKLLRTHADHQEVSRVRGLCAAEIERVCRFLDAAGPRG